MTKRILCVDDEPNVLQAFERQFRKRFELHTALGPKKGLEALSHDAPFAVVVSDLRMPEMDGIEFLARVRENWPDTVRIMLTGQADLSAAIAAVNQGNVFQFLSKPCPSEMLARALDAGLHHHRLIVAERELLEQTLRGSIGVMSEILGLANPVAFSRAERVRRYVLHIAGHLNLAGQWQYELAAMLSQIGCVAVPPDVLDKYYDAQPLDANEATILSSQGHVGQKLLARIPRLEEVAEMVGNQHLGRNTPEGSSAAVGTGSRLLQVALDFDQLVMRGTEPAAALSEMRKRGSYDQSFLAALEQVQVQQAEREVRLLKLTELKTGMTTHSEVRAKSGLLLMGTGQEITASAIARLQTFALSTGVVEPISVRMPHARRVPKPVAVEVGVA
ncbi:MAG: HD domain-containing phosphohydrolase [Bryobacteraceae bacterium]|jgi:response regulator RpfG family c-di-GMP phosphodiesterase